MESYLILSNPWRVENFNESLGKSYNFVKHNVLGLPFD